MSLDEHNRILAEQRIKLWVEVYAACVSSSEDTYRQFPSETADKALNNFNKRFPISLNVD